MKLKRILLGIVLLVVGGFIIVWPGSALAVRDISSDAEARLRKGPYYQRSLPAYQMELYGGAQTDLDKSKFDATTFNNTINWLSTQLVGTYPEVTRTTGYYNPGAIGVTSGLIASLVDHPPVSTPQYLADLGSSLGLVKPVYAQEGTGWNTLRGVLDIWKVFRNLSYLVFVLIFIAVGFMIMFRAKINPQTVISVEAAIPNLIITLIIITFSYAIASLMIDLIWVLIYLAINIFTSNQLLGTGNTLEILKTDLLGKSVIGLAFSGALLGGPGEGTGIARAAAGAIGATIESLLWAEPVEATFTGMITAGLAYLIIAIAIIFSMFKVFFMLLMSYVGIILSVIFAPFQLLGNAFPGSNALSGWLKGMLANVLVFPATAVMFMLAAYLTGATTWGARPLPGGISGTGGLPLLGGGDPNAFRGLIGLGMIMMMPKVLEMIKNALKVEKAAVSPGAAIAPLMGVAGLPGQGVQQAVSMAQMKYYLLPHKREEGPAADLNVPKPQ